MKGLGKGVCAEEVVGSFRSWLAELGAPSVLTTDGGPQFTSRKLRDFLKRWCVEHEFSSPYYPQANGRAECAVKSVKTLLRKTATRTGFDLDAFQQGLLELRNTPSIGGLSPAQILFGRPLKSFVFASCKSFAPEWQKVAAEAEEKASVLRRKVKEYFDRNSKLLPGVRLGSVVELQDPFTKLWSKLGTVVAVGSRRNYYVKTESGRVYLRNRRFLRLHRPSTLPPLGPGGGVGGASLGRYSGSWVPSSGTETDEPLSRDSSPVSRFEPPQTEVPRRRYPQRSRRPPNYFPGP